MGGTGCDASPPFIASVNLSARFDVSFGDGDILRLSVLTKEVVGKNTGTLPSWPQIMIRCDMTSSAIGEKPDEYDTETPIVFNALPVLGEGRLVLKKSEYAQSRDN